MRLIKICLTLAFLGAVLTVLAKSSFAYPPFVVRAAKFGAKDCTFCHVSPDGGPPWNARGQWLIKQKELKKADEVDVNWLADYKPGSDTPSTTSPSASSGAGAMNAVDSQFLKLEQDWMTAVGKHDKDTLSQLTADEFTLTSAYSTGERVTRDQFLSQAGQVNGLEFTYENFQARIYGDVAVVKTRLKSSYGAGEEHRGGDFLVTDIWVNRDGRWQMVARHSSLPAPAK